MFLNCIFLQCMITVILRLFFFFFFEGWNLQLKLAWIVDNNDFFQNTQFWQTCYVHVICMSFNHCFTRMPIVFDGNSWVTILNHTYIFWKTWFFFVCVFLYGNPCDVFLSNNSKIRLCYLYYCKMIQIPCVKFLLISII